MRYWFTALTLILGASLLYCGSLLWRISDAIPYCRSIALGDLDGDDDLDAFVANWPERAETVWTNDGDGQFIDSGQRLGDLRGLDAALGDVDGDGDLDAFVGNEGADEVWLNNGAGSFSNSGQALGDARTWHVTLGDVDGDGDLDALVEKQGTAQIWLNDGHGIFVESKQRLSPFASPCRGPGGRGQ
jgi:hypothetical protein